MKFKLQIMTDINASKCHGFEFSIISHASIRNETVNIYSYDECISIAWFDFKNVFLFVF